MAVMSYNYLEKMKCENEILLNGAIICPVCNHLHSELEQLNFNYGIEEIIRCECCENDFVVASKNNYDFLSKNTVNWS